MVRRAAQRRSSDEGTQTIVTLRPERITAMMKWDETDRNRQSDGSAEWSWYCVERVDPTVAFDGGTLATHIGWRLRIVYGVAHAADEPAAVRQLLKELEGKGM